MKNKIQLTLLSGFTALLLSSCATTNNSFADMVAIMEVKEPIDGVCDNSKVYALIPFSGNGQIQAVGPKTDEEILKELNDRVEYIKDKKDYSDKGMVSMIINCDGEMVQCKIDNKTQSPELDDQIVAVFSELKQWQAGTIHGNAVDCVELVSFKIEKGVFSFD